MTDTALVAAPGTALVKSHVPVGIKVKWYQRKEHIWIDIEAPDMEVEEVVWDDTGLIEVKAKETKHCLTMQLLHRIHTHDSRWWMSGRCLKMEIAKAEYGLAHWDRLMVGEKLPNVLIDWTSWIDEAEEAEVRPRTRYHTHTQAHHARNHTHNIFSSRARIACAGAQRAVRSRRAADGERDGRALGQQRRPDDEGEAAGAEGQHLCTGRRG